MEYTIPREELEKILKGDFKPFEEMTYAERVKVGLMRLEELGLSPQSASEINEISEGIKDKYNSSHT